MSTLAKNTAVVVGLALLLGAPDSVISNPFEPARMVSQQRRPNEAGRIPVLMYHRIGSPEGIWTRTPKNFRRDLDELYRRGYRPISLKDMVRGHIDLPAGFSPVVLTFDDGDPGQLRFVEKDGELVVDPDCAVGILSAFHEEHPDFSLEATFFLHGPNPFRQPEHVGEKLELIIARGMDIGNHTTVHADLRDPRFHDPRLIQKVIANQARFLQSKLKKRKDYEVNTFALCHGHRPRSRALRRLLIEGAFGEHGYRNIAILNVGSGPAPSPVDKEFNPHSLPRIRASQTKVGRFGMYSWLERLDADPDTRFISDGDPNTFTIPESLRSKIDPQKLERRSLVVQRARLNP